MKDAENTPQENIPPKKVVDTDDGKVELEAIDADQIAGALNGYTVVDTMASSDNKIVLVMQAPELPTMMVMIAGGRWYIEVGDTP